MPRLTFRRSVCATIVAGTLAWSGLTAHADRDERSDRRGRHGRAVFVVAMENHNWIQPAAVTSPQQIFTNPDAPFINSLVNGTSGISDQVAYATNYLNAGLGVHPSEPNYIWAEAGTDFGVRNDDDPYHRDCTPDTVQNTDQHLTAFLMRRHRTWRSYQEDTDVDLTTNMPLPGSSRTVPLFSISGTFAAGINAHNYSNQYNYAAKHNPMVYFTDTAGGCDTSASNPMRVNYAPLQQFALDLQNDDVADYNWVTPNQVNDQHTTLTNGYGGAAGTPLKGDPARIAQGDNFLARIVPLIMASDAYRDHGVIVLWWDESEGGDTSAFKLPFMIVSRDAHP
ncbi:MAG TPA: alkaline phosphatase family protein, partial [Vicinamibacterales bacterium]